MTRILMIETASPKRVREKAREILQGGVYPSPELTILCRPDPRSLEYLNALSRVRIVLLQKSRRRQILADLTRTPFDVAYMFWTGEKKYRWMKLTALRLRAGCRDVDIGDGNSMRLSWGNFARFLSIRCKYPRPSDHDLFKIRPNVTDGSGVPADDHQGEKVLVLQSAEAPYVLRALDRLQDANLFRNPRYTLFCRNREEVLRPLQGHSMLCRIITHSETRGAWSHLRELRRERFEAVVVLFTGDPSYWKIKCFAFLLGARHKVIFNENGDCFYLSWGAWLALIAHRMGERSGLGAQPRWTNQARFFAIYLVKALLLPFRFAWLFLVWLRLRSSGLRASD